MQRREPPPPRCVLTIGNFDGVHWGHRAILNRARLLAKGMGLPVRALTFDPFPVEVLCPGLRVRRLLTREERVEALKQAGADEVEVSAPTREFLNQTPEEFVEWLAWTHAPAAVVEGEDFRFGKGRAGDVEALRKLGEARGFAVHAVASVRVTLVGSAESVRLSSSLLRTLQEQGRGAAAEFMRRPPEVSLPARLPNVPPRECLA